MFDGAITGAESAQVALTSASTGFLVGKGSQLSLAGLVLLGGLWFVAARNPRPASVETSAVASAAESSAPMVSAPSSTPISPEREVSGVANYANPTADRDNARPVGSHHVRDRLAQEVALLSRAQAALRSGKPAVALEALNEHERKFGNGLLAEERMAARAQALCALGRNAEADAQLAQLSPNSLHGQSARQACGSPKNN